MCLFLLCGISLGRIIVPFDVSWVVGLFHNPWIMGPVIAFCFGCILAALSSQNTCQ